MEQLPQRRVGGGFTWVAHSKGLSRIEPGTGERDDSIKVRDVTGIGVGPDAIYAIQTFDRQISSIPISSDEAAAGQTTTGMPVQVAVGGDAVWYATQNDGNAGSSLVRLDPDSLEVVGEVELGPYNVTDMALDNEHVWLFLTGRRGQTVARVEATTLDSRVFPIPPAEEEGLAGIAVGEGAVWITRSAVKEVWKLDPTTGDRVGVLTLPHTPTSVAAGDGYLWVGTGPAHDEDVEGLPSRTYRIDPVTLQMAGEPILAGGYRSHLHYLVVGDGYVWTGHDSFKAVVQIDPGTR